MPSKSQKSKILGRKTASLSIKTAFSKKSGSQTCSETNSRCSTPTSNTSSKSVSRSSSRLQSKPRCKKSSVVSSRKFLAIADSDYDRESEYVYGSDLEAPSDYEVDDDDDDDILLAPSDAELDLQDEEDIDDDDHWSETSSVTRRTRVTRAPTPEFLPEEEIPHLNVPQSSTDLPITGRDLMQVIGVYEVIRRYSPLLRISPFKFEDFCASITCDEQCALISEIYTSLLKAVLREEDGNQTWYCPPDMKDSINIGFYFLDAMSWYESARAYLDSDKSPEFQAALPALRKESYFATTLKDRLTILQCFTDLFLSSNAVREAILKEGNIRYDEHCRYCHKLGDLLCCETCPAVYHLECVDPPLSAVPEDDWHCGVCLNHKLEGVADCRPLSEIHGFSIRHEPLGTDRHKRRYWFLARRIIIEGEKDNMYYSTKQSFDELMESLDAENWERSLVQDLDYVREEVYRQMAVTVKLTNRLKAQRKSTLDIEMERLQKIQDARAEKRRLAEEEEIRKIEEKLRIEQEQEETERKQLEEDEKKDSDCMIVEQQEVTESVKNSNETSTTSTTVSHTSVTHSPDGAVKHTSVDELTVTKTTSETTTTRTTVTVQSPGGSVQVTNSADVKCAATVTDGTSEVPTTPQEENPGGQRLVMKNQDGSLTHITVFAQPNQQIQNLLSNVKTIGSDAKPNVIQLKTNTTGGLKPGVINLSALAVNDKSPTVIPGLKSPIPANINVTAVSDKTQIINIPGVPKATAAINIAVNDLLSQNVAVPSVISPTSVPSGVVTPVVEPSVAPVPSVSSDDTEKVNETAGKSESDASIQNTTTKTENVTTTTESAESSQETRRISTRFKTGSLVPKFMDDYVTATKGSLTKAAAKLQAETVTTETVTKDHEVVRMTRSRTQAESMGVNLSALYRLGDEGHYKAYENEYSINGLALNKPQHAEDRDKKRQLSHKFSLTTLSEFKWSGSIHGNKFLTLATLREGLKLLESNIPPHFMHPAWPLFRNGWTRYVGVCCHPHQFANALCKLELVIKPVLFNHSWHEALGHWRLKRITLADREEQRKKDRDLEKLARKKDKEEEEVDRSRWCKYTLGLKHQVYKQRGEEYRVVSGDGWMWHSATRVHKTLPQHQCGLRALAKKIQAKKRLAIEAKIEEHLAKLKDVNYVDSDDESSIASEVITKVEPKVKQEDVKTSFGESQIISDLKVELDTERKIPKILISNDPVKTENDSVKQSDLREEKCKSETVPSGPESAEFSSEQKYLGLTDKPVHIAIKRVMDTDAPTPEKSAKPDDVTDEKIGERVSSPIEISDDESTEKRGASPIVVLSEDEPEAKPQTLHEHTAAQQLISPHISPNAGQPQESQVKVENKSDVVHGNICDVPASSAHEKMEVDDVKSEQGSESTTSAKSEVSELHDVKTDLMSERSRSKTVTPRLEADDNSVDIDSAAIEKMLRKQEKFDHIVNVSDALLRRTYFPKIHKPYSRLDHLLDRRQKQWKIETQQKQILDAVLLRCRVQTIQKKRFQQELEEKKRKAREVEEKEKETNAKRADDIKAAERKERVRSSSETDSDMEVNSQADDMEISGLKKMDKTKSLEDSIDEMDMGDIGMGKSQIELSVMDQYQCYSALCRADDNYQCYSVLCNLYKQKAENRYQDDDSLNGELIRSPSDKMFKSDAESFQNEISESTAKSEKESPVKDLDPFAGEIVKPSIENTDSKPDVKESPEPMSTTDTCEGETKMSPAETAASGSFNSAPQLVDESKTSPDSSKQDEKQEAKLSTDVQTETAINEVNDKIEFPKSPEKKKLEKAAEVKAIQEKYSIQQKDGNTFIMHGERFKVIEQSYDNLEKEAKTTSTTYDAMNLTNFTHAGKLSLPPIAIPDLEVKSYMCGKTRYKFELLKQHNRGRSMTRSRLMLKKGCIPNIHHFTTRRNKSSILILERFALRTLARTGGKREVSGYKYDCKMNNVLWPYPCPRPRMKTCWRYRSQSPPNLSAVALQIRMLWAAMRWDDLAMKAPQNGENTVTTDDEIRKKEIVDRREVGPHGLRSQFLVREIIIPLNVAEEPSKRDYTPIRSGLRERKRMESPKIRRPNQTERWINEEALYLWEIKRYYQKEDQARLAKQEEEKRKEEAKRPDERLTEQLELKTKRLESQQKRLAVVAADGVGQKENEHRPHIIRQYLSGGSKARTVVRVTPSISGSAGVLRATQLESPSGVVTKIVPKPLLLATPGTAAIRPKVITSPGGLAAASNIVPTKTTLAQIKPNTPGGAIQSLRIMQLPDGGYHVEGLQPGQQLVKLPGGRFQVITPRRPATTQVTQPANTTDIPILPTLQPAVNTPPATRVVQMQTPGGIVVKTLTAAQDDTSQMTPPTRVITTPQNTANQPKAAVQSTMPPKTQIVQIQLPGQPPRQVLLSGDQLSQLQALQAQGKVHLNLQGALGQSTSVVTTKPSANQLVNQPANASLLQTPVRAGVPPHAATPAATPQNPGGVMLIRTPTGQLAYVRQGDQVTQGLSPPIIGAAQLRAPPHGGPSQPGGVSSSVVQQMLEQAMQSSEDPDIQAKIAKLQRKMGTDAPVKARRYDALDSTDKRRDNSVALRQQLNERAKSSVTGRTKTRWPRSDKEMEERTVSAICQSLMKNMLDKIERSERKEARLHKKSVAWSERKERVRSSSLVSLLHRQKDALKADMMRKRALMESSLRQTVEGEIDVLMGKAKSTEKIRSSPERKRKQKGTQEPTTEAKKRRKSSQSESDTLTIPPIPPPKSKAKSTPARDKKQSRTPPAALAASPEAELSGDDMMMSARKRHKVTSTNRAKARARPTKVNPSQLYCICKTPYDDTKFYVGCDLCSNWFHGSCVGIGESQAKGFDSFMCDECRKAKEDTDEELYCLCRQPYDDKQFYVGCDGCQDWFHATCVGITREEAEQLEAYWCPSCEKNKTHDDQFNSRLIQRHHWELLKQVWNNVKGHKMAWPFLQPVDPNEVPDYYSIITDPMDLKTIKEKLDKRLYKTIGQFSKDMFRMFNNCRIYNPPTSPFFQCAEVLEIFFDKKQLTVLKAKL